MPAFDARVHSAVIVLIGCCSREATVEGHASKRCLNQTSGRYPLTKKGQHLQALLPLGDSLEQPDFLQRAPAQIRGLRPLPYVPLNEVS